MIRYAVIVILLALQYGGYKYNQRLKKQVEESREVALKSVELLEGAILEITKEIVDGEANALREEAASAGAE